MEMGSNLVCSGSTGERRLRIESEAVYSVVSPAFPLAFVTL